MSTGDALLLAQPDARVIEVTGEDRLTHLDATTTQALAGAAPGTASAALVLDANGNPLAVFDVLVLPDRVWLVTPTTDVTDVVMDVIAGRTFLADARFTVLEHHVARVAAPFEMVRSGWSGVAVVPDPATVRTTPSGNTAVAVGPDGALLLAGPGDEVDALLARFREEGAQDAGPAEAEAWRVAVGRPAWGREVAPPHLPEELGLLPTHVHLAKGCYPGQEAVARMWMLGRPRRRLARVRVATPVSGGAVAPGWRAGQGRDAVEVTSVAEDGTALAFVPGGIEAGTALELDGTVIEVLELVGDDPSPPGHDPAMRRRRDRTG